MVILSFNGNLVDLLPRRYGRASALAIDPQRDASVKDVVESFGVPHPEIEKIVVDGVEVDFAYPVRDQMHIEIYPVSPATDFLSPSMLRPQPLPGYRFIADTNVRKLGVCLRQLGFDTMLADGLRDNRIAAIAGCQRRILLTRDRGLLKRKIVEFGHLVREKSPPAQLREVVTLYGLRGSIKAFTRCLRCNGMLVPVAKEEVLPLLEPLTRLYYEVFHRCSSCGRVYWSGSHREKMGRELDDLLSCDKAGEKGFPADRKE